jgi:hypothetical protein
MPVFFCERRSDWKCIKTLRVFAPEGRDIYSLAFLSLVLSSVGAQPLLPCWVLLIGLAPNGAKTLCGGEPVAINISLRWSEGESAFALLSCIHPMQGQEARDTYGLSLRIAPLVQSPQFQAFRQTRIHKI